MQKFNVIEKVTQQIIDLLEKVDSGDITTWIPLSGLAYNPASKHTYASINQLLLSLEMYNNDYSHNNWLTYKQIQKAGGSVLKGEKSSMVTFTDTVFKDEKGNRIEQKVAWDRLIEKRKTNASISTFSDIDITYKRFIKYYLVWNIQQTKGVDPEIVHCTLEGLTETERIGIADQIVEESGAKIVHVSANSAHYDLNLDKIQMPFPEQFESSEEYYRVLFHEMIHWTGHESRLNRIKATSKEDDVYAFEELIAELGASFICAQLNIKASIRSSSAYIKSWLKALNDDRTFILKAISHAEKAGNYLTKQREANV